MRRSTTPHDRVRYFAGTAALFDENDDEVGTFSLPSCPMQTSAGITTIVENHLVTGRTDHDLVDPGRAAQPGAGQHPGLSRDREPGDGHDRVRILRLRRYNFDLAVSAGANQISFWFGRRYGTRFRSFDHTKEAAQAIFDAMETRLKKRESERGTDLKLRRNYPHELKDQRRKEVAAAFDAPALAGLRAEAKQVYDQLMATL